MIKNVNNNQTFFDRETYGDDPHNHAFDFIINRLLIEVVDHMDINVLDDSQFQELRMEVKKNLKIEFLKNIS